MLFSEMKKGQILGATFDDEDGVLPELRGRTFGFRVLSTYDNRFSEQVAVEDVKTGARQTFVGSEPGKDWACWKMVEPAVEV